MHSDQHREKCHSETLVQDVLCITDSFPNIWEERHILLLRNSHRGHPSSLIHDYPGCTWGDPCDPVYERVAPRGCALTYSTSASIITVSLRGGQMAAWFTLDSMGQTRSMNVNECCADPPLCAVNKSSDEHHIMWAQRRGGGGCVDL